MISGFCPAIKSRFSGETPDRGIWKSMRWRQRVDKCHLGKEGTLSRHCSIREEKVAGKTGRTCRIRQEHLKGLAAHSLFLYIINCHAFESNQLESKEFAWLNLKIVFTSRRIARVFCFCRIFLWRTDQLKIEFCCHLLQKQPLFPFEWFLICFADVWCLWSNRVGIIIASILYVNRETGIGSSKLASAGDTIAIYSIYMLLLCAFLCFRDLAIICDGPQLLGIWLCWRLRYVLILYWIFVVNIVVNDIL